jgi:hypothetical protein
MAGPYNLSTGDLVQAAGVLMGVLAFVLSVSLAVLRHRDLTKPRLTVEFNWGVAGTPGAGDGEVVYSVTVVNRGYVPATINGLRLRFKSGTPSNVLHLMRFMHGPRLPHRLEIQDGATWMNSRQALQTTFQRNGTPFPVRFYPQVMTTSGAFISRRMRRTNWPRWLPIGRVPLLGPLLGRVFRERHYTLTLEEI